MEIKYFLHICFNLSKSFLFTFELTVLPVNLILWDDDLARVDVTGVGDGMTQDADDSDHLANFLHTIHDVAGVADQLFAPCNLGGGEKINKKSSWILEIKM